MSKLRTEKTISKTLKTPRNEKVYDTIKHHLFAVFQFLSIDFN